jgi:5-methylcytosine-specific restriction protein A
MREQSRFHGSYRWKKARKVARIAAGHTCARCGLVVVKGLHTHHKKKVADHPAVQLEPQNLECVCGSCQNALEPRNGAVRLSGCNIDGSPTDPRHPWFTP